MHLDSAVQQVPPATPQLLMDDNQFSPLHTAAKPVLPEKKDEQETPASICDVHRLLTVRSRIQEERMINMLIKFGHELLRCQNLPTAIFNPYLLRGVIREPGAIWRM